jgi:tetratricopeptide (TPR) repeat protein
LGAFARVRFIWYLQNVWLRERLYIVSAMLEKLVAYLTSIGAGNTIPLAIGAIMAMAIFIVRQKPSHWQQWLRTINRLIPSLPRGSAASRDDGKKAYLNKYLDISDNARVLFNDKKYDDAYPMLLEMINMAPTSTVGNGLLGRIDVRRGNWEIAIPRLTVALGRTLINESIYAVNRGIAHLMLGNLGAALKDMQRAQKNSSRPSPFYAAWEALVWIRMNAQDKALQVCAEFLKTTPNHACLNSVLSIALVIEGDTDGAQSAIQLVRGFVHTDDDHYFSALAFTAIGDWASARKELLIAIEMDPRFVARGRDDPFLAALRSADNSLNSILNR